LQQQHYHLQQQQKHLRQHLQMQQHVIEQQQQQMQQQQQILQQMQQQEEALEPLAVVLHHTLVSDETINPNISSLLSDDAMRDETKDCTSTFASLVDSINFEQENAFCGDLFEPTPILEGSPDPIDFSTMMKNHLSAGPTLNIVSSTPDTFAASSASVPCNATNESKSARSKTVPKSNDKSKRLLPEDFEPTDNHIICYNKRKYFESKGNLRFREICKQFTNDYHTAPNKSEKSAVVGRVMSLLREGCPDGGKTLFVAPQGGRWYAVSARSSREKVGTFFRDCLADTYKSSSKNKIAKRKLAQQERSENISHNRVIISINSNEEKDNKSQKAADCRCRQNQEEDQQGG